MVARFFQPSRLGVVLLLGILLIQVTALWRKQTLMAMRTDGCRAYVTHRIGRPLVAEIHIDDQADGSKVRSTRFFPRNAIVILVGGYAGTMPLGMWLTQRRTVRRGFPVVVGPQPLPASAHVR
jgi:hypothetical protein